MKPQTKQTIFTSLAVVCLLVAVAPAHAGQVGFNFDTGTPAVTNGQNTPVTQTVNGLTAVFTGNYFVTTYNPADGIAGFSGLYLQPKTQNSEVLTIAFSKRLTSLSFYYASQDQNELAVQIAMSAFLDSDVNPIGAQVTTAEINNGFEQGTATLSGQPASFNLVTITTQGGGRPSWFSADNFQFVVDTSSVPEPASWSLIGLGITGLGLISRKWKAKI